MSNRFIFIDEENKEQYKEMLFAYLRSDFNRRKKPKNHFWCNRSTIKEAFDKGEAMVTLNEGGELIGYMIWSLSDDHFHAELSIVEVKENYRGQGIFKNMLTQFIEKFTETRILSASVLSQAEVVFDKAGWKCVQFPHQSKKYYKIVRPGLSPSDTLPNGPVIAICSQDFYQVEANLTQYQPLMKYFQLSLDQDGKLDEPIVTEYYYEGYIGVYFNKELICQGKAKHLFQGPTVYGQRNLLILNQIMPVDPTPFNEKGFFSQPSAKINSQKRVNENEINVTSTSASSSEQPIKKQRLTANSALFQTREFKEKPKEEDILVAALKR